MIILTIFILNLEGNVHKKNLKKLCGKPVHFEKNNKINHLPKIIIIEPARQNKIPKISLILSLSLWNKIPNKIANTGEVLVNIAVRLAVFVLRDKYQKSIAIVIHIEEEKIKTLSLLLVVE